MNDKELAVLKVLSGSRELEAGKLADACGMQLSALMSAAESLHTSGMANRRLEVQRYLKPAAGSVSKDGKAGPYLPETILLSCLGGKSLPAATALALAQKAGLSPQEANIALGQAVKAGLIGRKKTQEGLIIEALLEHNAAEAVFARVVQTSGVDESSLPKPQRDIVQALMKRGLLEYSEHKTTYFSITGQGRHALLASPAVGQAGQLTPQMLTDGSWREAHFRPYDLSTVAAPVLGLARKHPYKEFLNRIKMHLVGLGFREVGGPLVELEFWNMDALFMPQDHPARQIHDVFFIKEPAHGDIADPQLFKKVQEAHHHGGETGSRGWGYTIDAASSSRLLARSHDTGISARTLAADGRVPDRVFFITKAFRPDQVDWKHFIEFDQLGGYVAGPDICLRDLLGTLETFAREVFGAKKVKFAPGYFPFTEPSVEMYAQIPGKGWSEMGGAGLFRPEMLGALGIKHQVAAWGLGIGRLAMLTVGATDIRQLHSHDLTFLREH